MRLGIVITCPVNAMSNFLQTNKELSNLNAHNNLTDAEFAIEKKNHNE